METAKIGGKFRTASPLWKRKKNFLDYRIEISCLWRWKVVWGFGRLTNKQSFPLAGPSCCRHLVSRMLKFQKIRCSVWKSHICRDHYVEDLNNQTITFKSSKSYFLSKLKLNDQLFATFWTVGNGHKEYILLAFKKILLLFIFDKQIFSGEGEEVWKR